MEVNVEGIIDTLSLRIAQLEKDKAVLIEQAKYWQSQAEQTVESKADEGNEA